jgi:hypothetical protein
LAEPLAVQEFRELGVAPAEAFGYVAGNRIGCFTQLAGKFELVAKTWEL